MTADARTLEQRLLLGMSTPYNEATCESVNTLLHEAAEALSAKDAEIAALLRDAERYKWLRGKVPSSMRDGLWFHFEAPMHGGGSLEATIEIHRAALDAAIDSAIAKESQ